MKVTIKSFDVGMEVKTSGIEFEVRSPDGRNHRGDVYLTKRGLVWCQGRTPREGGVSITWNEFIDWMNGRGA